MLAVTSAMARLYPLCHVCVPKLVIISFSFSLLSNMTFSTRDEDNDRSGRTDCSRRHKGGWWYKHCHTSNLNGLYLKGRHRKIPGGVAWLGFRGYRYSLKRTEMKVKPIILN